jgi:hypothetical protein
MICCTNPPPVLLLLLLLNALLYKSFIVPCCLIYCTNCAGDEALLRLTEQFDKAKLASPVLDVKSQPVCLRNVAPARHLTICAGVAPAVSTYNASLT